MHGLKLICVSKRDPRTYRAFGGIVVSRSFEYQRFVHISIFQYRDFQISQ